MLLLQMERIMFLLNMVVDKSLLKEYCHSDAKPSPLKNETGLFFISFCFLYSPLRFEKNMCFLLFQNMGRKKSAVLLVICGEHCLQFKICDGVKISDFQVLVLYWLISPILLYFQFLSAKGNSIL